MRRGFVALSLAATMVLAVGVPTPAGALLDDTATPSTGMSLGTNTLAEPTGLTLTRGTCSTLTGDSLNISWSASASSWADGYDILRSLTGSGPFLQIAHVGAGTYFYNDANLAFSTSYYYRVRATKANWTSSELSTATITTRNILCL